MTAPTTYNVPPASSGKGLRIPTELLGDYGDVLKEDGKEAVTFGTGGVFTVLDIAPDGSYVDFLAVGETGADTATIEDEGESDTITLVVAAETASSLTTGEGTIIQNPNASTGTAATAAASPS
jgi:hypothetical protein